MSCWKEANGGKFGSMPLALSMKKMAMILPLKIQ